MELNLRLNSWIRKKNRRASQSSMLLISVILLSLVVTGITVVIMVSLQVPIFAILLGLSAAMVGGSGIGISVVGIHRRQDIGLAAIGFGLLACSFLPLISLVMLYSLIGPIR
jgi:hypothetical protein